MKEREEGDLEAGRGEDRLTKRHEVLDPPQRLKGKIPSRFLQMIEIHSTIPLILCHLGPKQRNYRRTAEASRIWYLTYSFCCTERAGRTLSNGTNEVRVSHAEDPALS